MSISESGESVSLTKSEYRSGALDDYLAEAMLTKTIGEVEHARESASNAKAVFIANLIHDAVVEMDMGVIKSIVKRVDGTVPDEGNRAGFANLMGDALEDVMSYGSREDLCLYPEDTVIVAVAKAVYALSVSHPDKRNYSLRKDRQEAIDMILERIGGRKTGPTKLAIETTYVEPDWMRGLGSGGKES